MAEKENISAMLDGEALSQDVISEVETSPEALETWASYHTIRDVMRGESASAHQCDIAGKVAMALEDEPAYKPHTASAPLKEVATQEDQLPPYCAPFYA